MGKLALATTTRCFRIFSTTGIVMYVPFHLAEEAFGNYPEWMYHHFRLPKAISYPHWLINNSLFFITLILGLFLFLKHETKRLFLAIGIMVWIFLNSMEHIIFSMKDGHLSPGFFTSIGFFVLSLIFFIYINNYKIPINQIMYGILAGMVYWAAPLTLIFLLGSFLSILFP